MPTYSIKSNRANGDRISWANFSYRNSLTGVLYFLLSSLFHARVQSPKSLFAWLDTMAVTLKVAGYPNGSRITTLYFRRRQIEVSQFHSETEKKIREIL